MVFDERRFTGGRCCSAPWRKVRFGPVNPIGFFCDWKDWLAGVDPSGVPGGRDALGSQAIAWPGVVVGQTVPNRQGFRGWEELHGSPSSSEAKATVLTQGLPGSLCTKDVWRQGVTLGKDLPRRPNRIEPEGLHITWFAVARRRISKHPFHGMRLPECMDASLVGALSVVVPRGVQRNVRVGEVVPQI